MALRVLKTGGSGSREFAQGSQPLRVAELDGDLDAIFNGITDSNILAGANIATAKLASDAGIVTGMLGAGSVTTTILANQPNGVTTGKVNVGASVASVVAVNVGAFLIGTVEGVIATLPSFTARGASTVVFCGTAGIRLGIVSAGAIVGTTLRLYVNRGGAGFALLQSWNFTLDPGDATATPTITIPTPLYIDTATAATQVYELRGITSSANGSLISEAANRGRLFAVELA